MAQTHVCETCKAIFTYPEPRRFCCHGCYAKSLRRGRDATCEHCGNSFWVNTAEDAKAKSRGASVRFCSRACWRAQNVGENNPSWKGGDIEYTCKNCAKTFALSRTRRAQTFCCIPCRAAYFRANPSESPNWRGGAASERECAMTRPEYRAWRKAVFERDDYTCRKCGERGRKIHAHHLYTWHAYPSLRYEIGNGHTLCVECHRSIRGKESEYLRHHGLRPDKPPLWLP